ncbi:MAG: thioredoxin domain-containing protein [Hyphomonadaceae bacterium]
MFVSRRSLLVMTGAAAALAACEQGGASAQNSGSDMSIGNLDSRVHLIEYASTTCPHCAQFHETVFPTIKSNYIDTNRIRFTFREFPTPPAPVAVAGFQLARCGGADANTYMTRIGVLFQQQRAILQTGTMGGVRDALLAIGRGAGLSDDQVMACITDQTAPPRIQQTVQDAVDRYNVSGTPALILNERLLPASETTLEALSAALDRALAG